MAIQVSNHIESILPMKSIGTAFFVTILWSSSWVIIKFGLEELPPIMFAGMRYSIASLILLGVLLRKSKHIKTLREMPLGWRVRLVIYGIVFITITQSMQFIGLNLLPAVTVTFMLNFTPIFVLLFGILMINEKLSTMQLIFVGLSLLGVLMYFFPFSFGDTSIVGLILVTVGVIANALSSILGRKYNRSREYSPLIITTISMTVGSLGLLIFGLLLEGIPSIGLTSLFYILWLAIVNTAFAFVLWNKAMQELSAIQITIINDRSIGI